MKNVHGKAAVPGFETKICASILIGSKNMNVYLIEILKNIKAWEDVISMCGHPSELSSILNFRPKFYYKNQTSLFPHFVKEAVIEAGSLNNLADACDVSIDTIKKNRKGTRVPSKELWIKYGLVLKPPIELLDEYMRVVGASLNTLYLDDIIYRYALQNRLSIREATEILSIYDFHI